MNTTHTALRFFRRLDSRTAARLAAIRARARGLACPERQTRAIPVVSMASLVGEARQ